MSTARHGSPDMAAMWEFLRGRGYHADPGARRRDYPPVDWSPFTAWAQETFRDGALE